MIHTLETHRVSQWATALRWGIGAALLHRFLLMLWMPLAWSVTGFQIDLVSSHDNSSYIPALTSTLEKAVFGVWRRWDAIHYLTLTANGYQIDNPGPTVFGMLPPLAFRIADSLLPGGIDLAAMVVSTVSFALALALLYRFVEIHYDDSDLARRSVMLMCILPLSYYFAAPISESLYLALVLACFYFAIHKAWFRASVMGALATLARSQGVLLPAALTIYLLQDYPIRIWLRSLPAIIKQGWPFVLIPAAFFGFDLWRQSLGLPSMNLSYRTYSYGYVTNPVDGLVHNFRWIAEHLGSSLGNIDSWALVLSLVGAFIMLRFPRHRKLPLVVYTFSFAVLFASRINLLWGTDIPINTQSVARYSLTLFPLFIMTADGIRHLPKWLQMVCFALLLVLLLFYSALHAIGVGPN